ncbi:MAG: response regulator transcription factor [Desulfobulbus sp.]|jgi:two-component system response regulator GlrR
MSRTSSSIPPAAARQLLIVDDDADMLKMLAKMLGKHCHCETVLATSAEEALLLVKQTPPAVVLSDIRMPGMDGLRFFEQLNQHVPAITTILISLLKNSPVRA